MTEHRTTSPSPITIGGWAGAGAAIGLLFGLMLSSAGALLVVAGTAVGAIVGALVDRRRRTAA